MGRGLIIVRHAMPAVDANVPSRDWTLTEASREDCVLLAHALPEELAPTVFCSTEPKAKETGAIIAMRRGLQTREDPGLGEVYRPFVSAGNDRYRETASRYIGGEAIPGWEPRDRVLFRFRSAVDMALKTVGHGDVVVATHGLAPTVYLAARVEMDAVAFWRGLTFPDAWRLDTETNELSHVFGGGLRGS